MEELVLRRLTELVALGSRCGGAGGASDLRVDHKETVESWLAERMRWVWGECRIESMEALWPYSASLGVKVDDSSVCVQSRIVRSKPEDMICVGDMKRAHFMEEVWPPAVGDGVVALTCEEESHIRRWPSKLADNILSWPGCVSCERTSTELTQSSCSKEAT